MVTAERQTAYDYTLEGDQEILLLEKSDQVGAVTKEDIADALFEYAALFKIGHASKAEILTLHRANPSDPTYRDAAIRKGLLDDDLPVVVIGGPASVEMVDREGHLITMAAMSKAFDKFMESERTRNVMVLHSDVQVGWALPAYINAAGQIFKSGVNDDRLFLLSEIRDDTKISQRVIKQIQEGKLHSYSIAGSAISTQTIQKGMSVYMQVDELELAEVTVCEQGVNQGADFAILKSGGDASKAGDSCIDGSCLIPLEKGVKKVRPIELIFKSGDEETINFYATLKNHLRKENDPLAGTAAVVLMNEGGRRAHQYQLTQELGLPAEVREAEMRYTPVEDNLRPGWNADYSMQSVKQMYGLKPSLVNEAGSELSTFTATPTHHEGGPKDSPNQVGRALQAFYKAMGKKV